MAAAIAARRAVTGADVASIVDVRAVRDALAVEAGVVTAAADVASVVLAGAGWRALATGAARAVAAANAAWIGVKARERDLHDGITQREKVFTNTVILE